ncbi:MAG: hypothetical protein WD184_05960 [Acidimicrobiia bacterium]
MRASRESPVSSPQSYASGPDFLANAALELPTGKTSRDDLRNRLAVAVVSTALTFSPSTVPFRRLDPAPPPAAVLPVGDPTPGIGSCRG